MLEKRKAERTTKQILVCFKGKDFSIFSKTRDISESGAFISTHYILTPGTEILIRMEEATPIVRKARVVHLSIQDQGDDLDNTGFGIEFIR